MKALIIEDEIPAAERLKKILNSIDPAIVVLDVCNSVEFSVKWLKNNAAPDVIFMDIELSDGRSFEIFKHVLVISKVIFITAYDDFAIKAIKLNALDYLLKPVDKDELAEAIKKADANKNREEENYEELTSSYFKISAGEKPKKLVVHDTTGARFISIEKIIRLKADSNYTHIYLNGGESIVSSRTLKYYEELLANLGFFRISNTWLINLAFIEKYVKGAGGDVQMADGSVLEVSRQKKKELMDALSLNP